MKQRYDIQETLWTGESSTQVLCNWGLESQMMDKGQAIGEIQPGTVVYEDDPVWSMDEAFCAWYVHPGWPSGH